MTNPGLFQSVEWENKPVPVAFGVRAAAASSGSHGIGNVLVLRFGTSEEERGRAPAHTASGCHAHVCVRESLPAPEGCVADPWNADIARKAEEPPDRPTLRYLGQRLPCRDSFPPCALIRPGPPACQVPGKERGPLIPTDPLQVECGLWRTAREGPATALQGLCFQLLFVQRQVRLPTSSPRGKVFAGVRRSL